MVQPELIACFFECIASNLRQNWSNTDFGAQVGSARESAEKNSFTGSAKTSAGKSRNKKGHLVYLFTLSPSG
jgi:hypothetical protein